MNAQQSDAISAAEAKVKRLRKRVSYWKGRSKAALNQRERAMYRLACEPDNWSAQWDASEVALSNLLIRAENYSAIASQEAAALRIAEEALTKLQEQQ